MSEAWAYAGAALLLIATIPQAVKLLRTRSASDLGWPFVILNATGIALLGLRSWEIGERAFLTLNAATATFWLLVAWIKLEEKKRTDAEAASKSAGVGI